MPLPIENKWERDEQAKEKPISTIRSRQRKTTDCLLATALWFVSGSFSLTIELCVSVCVCECIMCVVYWYNPSWCRGCRRRRHCCCRLFVICSSLLPCLRVLYVTTLENFIKMYWLWHVMCAIEPMRRQNERANEYTRRWETKKSAHLFSFSFFYFNISFFFLLLFLLCVIVCMHSPRPNYTKKPLCMCSVVHIICYVCFLPKQQYLLLFFSLSGSQYVWQQVFNGNWSNEWWTSRHRSVWICITTHVCTHMFVVCGLCWSINCCMIYYMYTQYNMDKTYTHYYWASNVTNRIELKWSEYAHRTTALFTVQHKKKQQTHVANSKRRTKNTCNVCWPSWSLMHDTDNAQYYSLQCTMHTLFCVQYTRLYYRVQSISPFRAISFSSFSLDLCLHLSSLK